MNEFIIVFRETLEATLIVGIIYVFLLKQQIAGALTKLWMGVAFSIIASLIVAYLILLGQQHLEITLYKRFLKQFLCLSLLDLFGMSSFGCLSMLAIGQI